MVDAAYVGWGSADGPYPSSGVLACGQALVSPWDTGSGTAGEGIFEVPNCSAVDNPGLKMTETILGYMYLVEETDIDCTMYQMQAACDALDTSQNCIEAAVNLAQNNASFTLPDANTLSNISSFANELAVTVSDFIEGSAGTSTAGDPLTAKAGVLTVINTYGSLYLAYEGCGPSY